MATCCKLTWVTWRHPVLVAGHSQLSPPTLSQLSRVLRQKLWLHGQLMLLPQMLQWLLMAQLTKPRLKLLQNSFKQQSQPWPRTLRQVLRQLLWVH